MTSSRPYLIRAIWQWIVDNGHVPHMIVDAEFKGVVVPRAYVHEGQIVLNIGVEATRRLELGDDAVTFQARFGGAPMNVMVPVGAVLGIVDRDTGQGMVFPDQGLPGEVPGAQTPDKTAPTETPADESDDEEPPRPPRGGRGGLRVVK
ncbi:MAG: ClpXP protease specificity-enhancing factor [Pseudomonadota bacterium]